MEEHKTVCLHLCVMETVSRSSQISKSGLAIDHSREPHKGRKEGAGDTTQPLPANGTYFKDPSTTPLSLSAHDQSSSHINHLCIHTFTYNPQPIDFPYNNTHILTFDYNEIHKITPTSLHTIHS